MSESGSLRGSTLTDLAAEFQPMFDQRADEIEQERQERAHRLEMAQHERRDKAQQVADAFEDAFTQLHQNPDQEDQ